MKWRGGRHLRRGSGHVRFYADLDLSMVNLPRVHFNRDPDVISLGLSWGNGWSDPVWNVEVNVWRRPS